VTLIEQLKSAHLQILRQRLQVEADHEVIAGSAEKQKAAQLQLEALDALAASGLLWATYRPQHHEDCAIFDGPCATCGRERRTLEGWHPNSPPGPNPGVHRYVSINPCDCGLSALLAQLETP
jgi:hypothetical protein